MCLNNEKRNFIKLASGLAVAYPGLSVFATGSLKNSVWDQFKSTFIKQGRVLDNGNGNITHSEGQGIALLASVFYNDKPVFDELLAWTLSNLQRKDGLFSWRWENSRIVDENNATDADIYIGWALIEAALKWNNLGYAIRAAAILDMILRKCVKQVGELKVLLPGSLGFEDANSFVVNPSYYVTPAFEKFYHFDKNKNWLVLKNSANTFFKGWGAYSLPADWLAIDKNSKEITIWDKRPARWGYEAIRIPSFLVGDRNEGHPSAQAYFNFFAQKRSVPAWIDLKNNSEADYAAPIGFYALLSKIKKLKAPSSVANQAPQYYDYFLMMLADICIANR